MRPTPQGYSPVGGVDRLARSRLSQNEISLLAGLLVQSESPEVYSVVADAKDQAARADALLEELHQSLEAPMRASIRSDSAADEPTLGDLAKEAIYYGAQSAFPSQYLAFARQRYREDWDWFLRNEKISIGSIVEIADALGTHFSGQMTAVFEAAEKEGQTPDAPSTTSGLIVPKRFLTDKFGDKAEAFLALFSCPIQKSNFSFTDPFTHNEAKAKPLLAFGEYIYCSGEYALAESVYESPYYWMLADVQYRDTASIHRGKFLESQIAYQAEKVFGKKHVFLNATIYGAKGVTLAEADVLIVYGEFVLVIQAKSKRLTLKARAGDTGTLEVDFQHAVQAAYDQATHFAQLIKEGAEFVAANQRASRILFVTRTFPIVILSDHFPSLPILIDRLLKPVDEAKPVVVDVFFLQVALEVLGDPVEVLYYLQQRSRFFDVFASDSEFNFLGFHLKDRLYADGEFDRVLISSGFATEIEDYWIRKELHIAQKPSFPKLEQRMLNAEAGRLISFLKAGPPETAGAAIDLADFSSDAIADFMHNAGVAQDRVRGGKAFSAFSVRTHFGGLSYVAVNSSHRGAIETAERVGRRHKYKQKQDRWTVLLHNVHSERPLDGVFSIWDKWEPSKEMDEDIAEFDRLVPTIEKPFGASNPAEGKP